MATILVVDDRPTNRELLVTLLGYAGHRLLEAAEGEEGLVIARAERPDLIITDIVMPTMDGYEFAHQVRADPTIARTQIIFYTSSYIVDETRRLAEACGVSIVISKPVEPQMLLDTVHAALNTKQIPTAISIPNSEDFHREHMRLLTDTLVKKIDDLEAEITERKRAEEALREKERLLSEAQKIGRMGSWSYSIPADTLQFSNEMYRLFDISAQDFQHTRAGFLTLIYAADQPQVLKWMDLIRTGRQVQELGFRIFLKTGELRYIQSRGVVRFDPDGHPISFIGIAQDVTERKLAEIQIHQQLERLTALSKIDQAIISTFDLGIMMEAVLAQVTAQLQVDAADVLLLDRDSHLLEYVTGRGFRIRPHERLPVLIGHSLAGRVAKEKHLLRIENLNDHVIDQPDDPFISSLVAKENFVSYFGVPLINSGKVKGVLEVFHRTTIHPYAEWVDFLNVLAGQAAIAIENASLFGNLELSNRELSQAYDATIEGWSRALDLRDKETEGHTLRVTKMTLTLAQKFNFTDTQMRYIRWGGLLHDIGKMGIPDNILLKPDKLTAQEWEIMRQHPVYSYNLLEPIGFLKPALDIPYCHHERWDGTGYPRGLKGEEIPLQARIFAVVDVWDALCSDRPYRKAWAREKTLEHIKSLSGTHFEPKVVQYYLEILK
jgi:putative nucleotidyltransferase with HDIG domain